jgi:oxygen-independent coproporphyrinogen III oxidase
VGVVEEESFLQRSTDLHPGLGGAIPSCVVSPLPQLVPSLRPRDLPRGEIVGLYVHVPFCFHKCHYCDFYSITRQTPARMERFVDLLLAEADLWRDGPSVRPRTVFFGGGTPSLLPIDAMARLLAGLRERFDWGDIDEFTVEVNPATADLDYLRMLRAHGVDRISLGAQSFDVAELHTLERHHHPDDVPRGVALAREAGFTRINLDLIYAIPSQTLASWHRSLEAARAIGTTHLSCYALTYEPNTPMAVKKRLGSIKAVDESLELQMLRSTRSLLRERGLPAYEISNHAVPGEACRHNLMYWRGGSYLGLGPSSASHAHGVRFRNRPHLREWEQAIEAGQLPAIDIETLNDDRRASERIWTGLRLTEGVDVDDVQRQTGIDVLTRWADELKELQSLDLIMATSTRVCLTDRGIDVADAVAARFM